MPVDANDIKVSVTLDIANASREWKAWLAMLRQLFPTAEAMQKAIREVEDRMYGLVKRGERTSEAFREASAAFRGLNENLADTVKVGKELEQQQKAIVKAGDPAKVQEAIKAHSDLIAQYREEYKTLEQVDAQLNQLRSDRAAVLNSTEANTQAGREAVNGYNQQIAALEQVRHGLVAQRNAVDDATKAHERQNKSITALLKKAGLWALGVRSVYMLYRQLRRAVEGAITQVYGETQACKDATEALKKLGQALVIATVPPQQVTKELGTFADFAEHVSKRLMQISAAAVGYREAFKAISDDTGAARIALELFGNVVGRETTAFLVIAAMEAGILTKNEKYLAIATETAQKQLEINNETLRNAGDIMKKAASAAETLTSQYLKLKQAQQESTTAAIQARQDYEAIVGTAYKPGTALGSLAAEQMRIEMDLAKQINQINTDALAARTAAYGDYQAQIAQMQAQARIQEQSDAKRHALEMEYAQKRHQLDMIQNERIYQYSRQQLVAEGDVLAIEDLDARYKLERQAAEENFALQQEQAEAMYRLQAKLQQEAMREQMQAMQLALQEQLRQIEQARRDEVAEAEAAAAEKQLAADQTYADMVTDAAAAYQEQLEKQKEAQDKQREENAQFLAQFAIDNELELGKVLEAWQEKYGPDGELVLAAQQAYEEINDLMEFFTPKLAAASRDAGMQVKNEFLGQLNAMKAEAIAIWNDIQNTLAGGAGGPIGNYDFNPYKFNPYGDDFTPRGFQHGGEMIVSQPTSFKAGEHGTLERVVVQPLSPIGGNIGVSWQGGAIPLHGTGTLTGADMGAMSGIFNQMLRSFAMEYIRQRSNIRGQRGR